MNRKSLALALVLLAGFTVVALGIARAQQAASNPPVASGAACPCMQGGMMGQRMRGMPRGAMGMGPEMMRLCPLMLPGTAVEVKDIDHGATITITSDDAKTARRIQLLAEMMRDMKELRSQQ